jgi:TM2 domain-containing membrane protein YozV
MFCSKCGSSNSDSAGFCAKCGTALAAATGASTAPPAADPGTVRTSAPASTGRSVTDKNPTVALVLSIFLGALGGGQFYNGDWKKGLAMAGASIVLGVATGGLVSFGVWVWSMVDAWQVAGGKWKAW